MKITHGLLEGQVLQRDSKGKGTATIVGKCSVEGQVEVRVTKAPKTVINAWTQCGETAKKSFKAELPLVKSGGPYRAEFRVRKDRTVVAECVVSEFYVGDVWILAGQSNMQGIGDLTGAPKPHPLVRAFFMRDEWGLAKEKMHFLEEAVDSFHNGYGSGPNRPPKRELDRMLKEARKGVGPGLGFALEMRKRSRIPQGLICCAHGGTSMNQWSPEKLELGGASLYGAMIRRYKKLGQKVAGVLWYQGESDANPNDIKLYTQRMKDLVEATRRDTELPNLPWCVVQLGRHTSLDNEVPWNSIQEQQRRLPDVIEGLDIAPAVDLDLDDGIHISGVAQNILGERLARVADRLVHGNKKSKKAITLKSIRLVPNPAAMNGLNDTLVEVTYDNVVGQLTSQGLPTGFALIDRKKRDCKAFYKTTLKGTRVFLYTNMNVAELESLRLSYGHGKDPYCNITDKEGFSLPVMQMVPIVSDLAEYCVNWQTKALAGPKTLSQVSYTKAIGDKGWKPAPPRAGIGVLPKARDSKKIGLYTMRTTVTAIEDTKAYWYMWVNAPFKTWLNGKPLLDDPKASPPLNQLYKKEINLKKGENEVVFVIDLPRPVPFLGMVAKVGDENNRRIEGLST